MRKRVLPRAARRLHFCVLRLARTPRCRGSTEFLTEKVKDVGCVAAIGRSFLDSDNFYAIGASKKIVGELIAGKR
jgi:hypothetical protein